MSVVSWLSDSLAHAYRAAELYALAWADPLDQRRAMGEHLRGAVEALLTDRRVNPRTPEARAIVDAIRERAQQRAALMQAEAGRAAGSARQQ